MAVLFTVVPVHATATWGASPADLGKLYSAVTLLSLVFAPLSGILADRIGRAPVSPDLLQHKPMRS